jgi:hypothetical protein
MLLGRFFRQAQRLVERRQTHLASRLTFLLFRQKQKRQILVQKVMPAIKTIGIMTMVVLLGQFEFKVPPLLRLEEDDEGWYLSTMVP